MMITGISAEQFAAAIDTVSSEVYGGNLRAEIGTVYSGNRFAARILPRESGARIYPKSSRLSAPGARRSWSGRRIQAACWHAYRDGIQAVFDINPNARVRTGMAKYIGQGGFLENYPLTANQNIGSMIQPAYMPELCDCDIHGIDTRENG